VRPHTSFKTQKAITELGWTVLPHPPYSPNLAHSDFHFFGALKDAIRRQRFRSNDEVIEEVRKRLRLQNSNLYKKRRDDSVSHWYDAVEVDGCYVETCNILIFSSCEYVQRITQSSTSIENLCNKTFWAAFVYAERKGHRVVKNRSDSILYSLPSAMSNAKRYALTPQIRVFLQKAVDCFPSVCGFC
jgi:hypothetical protein